MHSEIYRYILNTLPFKFGVKILKEIKAFIQQECIILIKSESKTFIRLQSFFLSFKEKYVPMISQKH